MYELKSPQDYVIDTFANILYNAVLSRHHSILLREQRAASISRVSDISRF